MDKRTTSAAFQTEQAKSANRPRNLITIALTDPAALTLYFCDGAAQINFPSSGGNTYYPWSFELGTLPEGMNDSVSELTINFDNTNTGLYAGNARNMFRNWAANYRFAGAVLTLSKIFADEVDSADDAMVLFSGICRAPEFGNRTMKLTVVSAMSLLQGEFPARDFSNTCHWKFDDTECKGGGASLADLHTGAAEAGSTTTVIIDTANRSEADGYWRCGRVTFTDGANSGIARPIKTSDQSSGTITLKYAFPYSVSAGDTYEIIRGCDNTAKTCRRLHDNYVNNGGFQFIPGRREGGI